MTRYRVCGVLPIAAVLAVLAQWSAPAAQDLPHLEGRWTLNRSLSQIPKEVGFSADWMTAATAPASGTSSGGGRGRRGSGGGGGGGIGDPFRGKPQSADDASRARQLTAEVRSPSAHLNITDIAGAITIADDLGHVRTFRPDGREAVLQLADVPVGVTARWEAGKLVVVYNVEVNRELRFSYGSTSSPAQLTVDIQFVERGGGDKVHLVYEPTSATETGPAPAASPTAAAAKPGAVAPAAGTSTPPQPFNQEPDAELKGLNALGILVEDLSSQAAACGLNKDALETALSNRFSSAGFKVRQNSDEDTYVYVNVITTSLSNGLCVSRYDAFLYTHTTATLSYQQKPVLVQVSLLHKGSVTGGAPATHAAAVLQALQGYVDQFTARIRNANK